MVRSTYGSTGCAVCPLDNVSGLVKIIGRVQGKSLSIWAMNPGRQENNKARTAVISRGVASTNGSNPAWRDVGMELVGPSGQLLWTVLREFGLEREDVDIQNVVRCATFDGDTNRPPTKEEIQCCSVHTEVAITQSKAKVHLVLGILAAQALLGDEYSRDRKSFMSERLKAWVIVTDHPAYLLRGGGAHPEETKKAWKESIRAAVELSRTFNGNGQRDWIDDMDYQQVSTYNQLERVLSASTAADETVAVDLEWNSEKIVCAALCFQGTHARVINLGHPGAPIVDDKTRELLYWFLENEKYPKVFQSGVNDCLRLEKDDVHVNGFCFDTQFGEYFYHSDRKHYSLDLLIERRFPQFATAKDIVGGVRMDGVVADTEIAPWLDTPDLTPAEAVRDITKVPWERAMKRVAVDADFTKRIELAVRDHVSLPLMQVYIDSAFILKRMEDHGPFFDFEQQKKLGPMYAAKIRRLKLDMMALVNDPLVTLESKHFGNPKYLAHLLYTKWDLGRHLENGAHDTTHDTLKALAPFHKFPAMLDEYRSLTKAEGTYIVGYEKRAKKTAGGRIHTFYWQTGTGTGRVSSGGDSMESAEESTSVNLQNVHGNRHLKNLLVVSPDWRTNKAVIFLALDGSQFEVRDIAEQGEDDHLIELFKSDGDIHSLIGNAITDWPVSVIQDDEGIRVVIKGMVFRIMYEWDTGGYGLYMTLKATKLDGKPITKIGDKKLSKELIEDYLKKLFTEFPGLARYRNAKVKEAWETGRVTNQLGFYRHIEVNDATEKASKAWKNAAVNTPVQGEAHQILLIAIALIKRKPVSYSLLQNTVMEVHDELCFRVPTIDLFRALDQGRHLLQTEVLEVLRRDFKPTWRVPLKVDPKAGFRRGTLVKLVDKKGNPRATTPEEVLTLCAKADKEADDDLAAGNVFARGRA